MFGAADSRISYIRKPSAGFSRLQTSSASNSRVPVAGSSGSIKEVRSTNAQLPSSLKKKTSEELFREHKEAAIAWAAQRKQAQNEKIPENVPMQPISAPVFTVPSPPRQHVSATPRENISAAPPALAFTISPPKHQSLSSPSLRIVHERDHKPLSPSSYTSRSVKTESIRQFSPQAGRMNVPVKAEGDFGPFSPAQSAGQGSFSPQFAVPTNNKPKESIFARFKKEAQEEAEISTSLQASINSLPKVKMSSPMSLKPEDTVSSTPPLIAKKNFQERILDLVGVSTLKQHERTFLVGLLIASPVLIYLFEVFVQRYILPAHDSTSDGLFGVYSAICAEFSTMTPTDLAISAVLAVALTLVFDRNTRATDACIRRDWRAVTTTVATIRHTLLEYIGQGGVEEEQDIGVNQLIFTNAASSKSPKGGALARVQSVLSVFTRIPIFVRFVVTILMFGAVFRVVLGHVVGIASSTIVLYAPVLLVSAALLVCALVGFLFVRYTLRRRATRSRVVKVLVSVVKSLLQQRGRAYPILYLYEEVAEVVSLSSAERSATSLPLFSPGSTPAVVHSATTTSYLGTPSEPQLFGSPLGMSNSSKENLLMASVQEADGGAGNVSASSNANKRDVLEGLKLPHLWKEVQKAVEADRRIQRLELIMDGKKHTCWRLLTGNTQASI